MPVIKLHYKKIGSSDKPAILLLHGFMGSADDWEFIINSLSDDHYFIVVDLPGHGQSLDLADSAYSLESTSRMIIDILNRESINRLNLCAYSMGGRIAYLLLTQYPHYFQKAIIESSTPGMVDDDDRHERIASDKKLAEKLLAQPLDKFINAWYRLPLFESLDKASETYKQLLKRRLKNSPEGLAKSLLYMGTGSMPSLWGELEKISADLLLIVGQKDTKFKAIANDVATHLNKSEVVTIENAGHNVHLEQPELFVKVIKEFLNRKRK